ncbi:hypothetical protein RB195_011476 [Necator americanus]|uniref:Uncharacterized protein n=1 Tax=Necator americanus TaxID=51031 RepID=A0ABR1D3H9_NECAM
MRLSEVIPATCQLKSYNNGDSGVTERRKVINILECPPMQIVSLLLEFDSTIHATVGVGAPISTFPRLGMVSLNFWSDTFIG